MSRNDSLIRGVLRNPALRFALADCTSLCRDGIIAHNCNPSGAAALTDGLGSAACLAVLLDKDEEYSLKLDYSGSAGSLLLSVNADCDVRGMVANPRPAGGVSADELYGTDDIPVTAIKFSQGKILNSGTVNCGMGRPADNIGMFFALSDQLETEFAGRCEFNPDPGDPVRLAAYFMLQAMPGCDLEEFAAIREKMHGGDFMRELTAVAEPLELRLKRLLRLLGCDDAPENCVYSLAGTPGFRCRCSREAMRRAMTTLGREELDKLFDENSHPAVQCRFCNKKYHFSREDF